MQHFSVLLENLCTELTEHSSVIFSILTAVDLTLDEYNNLPLDAFRDPAAKVCRALLDELGNIDYYWLIVLNTLDRHYKDLEIIASGQSGPNLGSIARLATKACKVTPSRHYELASKRVQEVFSRR